MKDSTYRWPGKRSVIAVLLPGLVEALDELLKESVRLVENGKAQDVDSVVHLAVQALQGKLLKQPKPENTIREENKLQKSSETLNSFEAKTGPHSYENLCVEPTLGLKSTHQRARKSLGANPGLRLLMKVSARSIIAQVPQRDEKPSKAAFHF